MFVSAETGPMINLYSANSLILHMIIVYAVFYSPTAEYRVSIYTKKWRTLWVQCGKFVPKITLVCCNFNALLVILALCVIRTNYIQLRAPGALKAQLAAGATQPSWCTWIVTICISRTGFSIYKLRKFRALGAEISHIFLLVTFIFAWKYFSIWVCVLYNFGISLSLSGTSIKTYSIN